MEGFLSINWDKAGDDSSSFFPKNVFEKSSAAYHSLHKISQSPWPSSDEQIANIAFAGDASTGKWDPCTLKREVIPGVGGKGKVLKVPIPVPFSSKSVLNAFEQKDYLFSINRIMKAFSNRQQIEPADAIRIKDLKTKLSGEVQEYQKLALSVMKNNPSVYCTLKPGIAKYAQESWKAQLENVGLCPPFYKLVGNVVLIPKENYKTFDMTPEQTVLELGRIPCPIFPPLNSLMRLERSYKSINNRFPAASTNVNQQVSRDSNAIKLAQKYGVNIVVSSNTLRALAGSSIGPLYRCSWDIPFSISEMNIKGESTKVIFIDEPLPPAEMTAKDKNVAFNIAAVKYTFLNQNRSRYYTYPDSKKLTNPTRANSEEDIFGSCDVDTEGIETFGVDKKTNQQKLSSETKVENSPKETHDEEITEVNSLKTCKTVESISAASDSTSSENSLLTDAGTRSPHKRRKTERSDTLHSRASSPETDSSEQSLKIDIDEELLSLPSRKQSFVKTNTNATKKLDCPTATKANLLNVILQDQQKMMQSSRRQPLKQGQTPKEQENPKDYVHPSYNQNVTYRTWDLKANENSIRLLVRSSVDAAIVTPNDELRTFLMVPKVEYQPWFGAECLTPREMNEQWMDLHLRPGCRLFRVRMDAYTGDLMMVEQKDASCLNAETNFQYGDKFKPASCLSNIWAILSSLCEMELSPGSFLLRHGLHDGICVQVCNSTERESSSLDIHQIYGAIDPTISTVRSIDDTWLALDPWLVLPTQRALNRPPLTFEPTPGKFMGPKRTIDKKKSGKKNSKPNQTKKEPTKNA